MHIALGYYWFSHGVGFHIERALKELGHTVTYVGAPGERAGYDSALISLPKILSKLNPKPDLYLWIDPGGRYFPSGIEQLQIPTACYLVDVHLGHWRATAARFFDAVLIAQKNYVDQYRSDLGHQQVWWLPLAAAPDIHFDHQLERSYDVGFVGSVTRAHQKSDSRLRRLRLIQTQFKTNDVFAPTDPAEVGRIYSRSKIVLNTSLKGDITMRIFEGTACGALMLTDATTNGLEDLFEVGQDLVTFQDDDDMQKKICHYLQATDERKAIATRGYAKTHGQHTYKDRMKLALDYMAKQDFCKCAPLRTATPNQQAHARHIVWTHLHMLNEFFDDARRGNLSIPIKLQRTLFTYLRRIVR